VIISLAASLKTMITVKTAN